MGCHQGNCGICEVEIIKQRRAGEEEYEKDPSEIVVRSCVAAVPRGWDRIEVSFMEDDIWNVDGFDT